MFLVRRSRSAACFAEPGSAKFLSFGAVTTVTLRCLPRRTRAAPRLPALTVRSYPEDQASRGGER
jgi:hypothetical protein